MTTACEKSEFDSEAKNMEEAEFADICYTDGMINIMAMNRKSDKTPSMIFNPKQRHSPPKRKKTALTKKKKCQLKNFDDFVFTHHANLGSKYSKYLHKINKWSQI